MVGRLAWLSRSIAAIIALAAIAWFLLGARQAHDTTRAAAILAAGSHLSAAQARTVGSLLRSAGQLNPDQTVDTLRAQQQAERGDRRAATAILLGVVHSEPMNAQAWEQLAATTRDRTTYIEALISIAHLVHTPHPR